jgi:hypothetical protein
MKPIRVMFARGPSSIVASYWNPADKGSNISLSGTGNYIADNIQAAGSWTPVRSITSHSTGKWYAENLIAAMDAQARIIFGVGTAAMSVANGVFVGQGAGGWAIQNDTSGPSTLRLAGSATVSGLTAAGVGARHMVAYDAGAGKIWLGSGGAWHNSGDPAAGTNPTVTIAAGTALYLACSIFKTLNTTHLKNQTGENAHTIPSGFSMWG